MPYNYSTGVANNASDLKAAFVAFCRDTLGWSELQTNTHEMVSGSSADADGRNTTYLRTNSSTWFIATGINGSSTDYRTYMRLGCIDTHSTTGTGSSPHSYSDQAEFKRTAYCHPMTGPYTAYHFFGGQEGTEGNFAYCALEMSAGIFTHFGIGELDRIGDTKVPFAVAMHWDYNASYWRTPSSDRHQRMFDSRDSGNANAEGHIYFSQPNSTETHYRFANDGTDAKGGNYTGLNSHLIDDYPNEFNGRHILLPCHVYCNDRGSPTAWNRLLGLAPAYRQVRLTNLQPGDIIDTDWMVFPYVARNAPTGVSSGSYGIAYKFQ